MNHQSATVEELIQTVEMERYIVKPGDLLIFQLTRDIPRELFEVLAKQISGKLKDLGIESMLVGPEFRLAVVNKEEP